MCWIGFVESPGTESWYWADGARTPYRNWDQEYKQPGNNKGIDEEHAILNSKRVQKYAGTWFDARLDWGRRRGAISEATDASGSPLGMR